MSTDFYLMLYLCFAYFCGGVYFLHYVHPKFTVYGKVLSFFGFPVHFVLGWICGIFIKDTSRTVQSRFVEVVGAVFVLVTIASFVASINA